MKIQMKHLISGCALLAVGLTACSDDDFGAAAPITSGDRVRFAASGASTRTIYDDANIFQINWESQDKIKIYSNKAYENVSDADYTVAPIETADSKNPGNKLYNEGSIAASGSSALMWADNEEHKFIGVYPSDNGNIRVDADKGTLTLPINRAQYCDLVTVADGNYYSEKYSGYTYYAKPDMKNAYLVAYNALTPAQAAENGGEVFLDFKPVMTAVEVVVKGRANSNEVVNLTGISIIRKMPKLPGANEVTSFTWDAVKGEAGNKLPDNWTGDVQYVTSFVGIKGGAAVKLKQNESIVFTVFLPPYAVDANWPMQVRAHATGNTELYTKDITNEILASHKRRVTLPEWYSTDGGNNWITPLDGSIYVSQMSIPGSHDAATGEDMSTIIGDIFASTQEQTLDRQWDLGVRAFDLRPALYDKNKAIIGNNHDYELWLYHGVTRIGTSWATAMNTIKAKLAEHPGEFAIVLFRHEDESTLYKNTNANDFNTYMTNYINNNKERIVDWKPDLTIDEARGKVILISRFNGSWEYGCFTGWSHDAAGTVTTLRNASNSLSATMYVQDYYNPSSAETKWASISKHLDISRTFHTDAEKVNHWMINHASGYVGSSISATYRNNAAAQNPNLINALTDPSWKGSTGIMLFDYSGAATSGNTTVKGDVALQTIINNNYKYVMKCREN